MMQASNHLWRFLENFHKVKVIEEMVSQCLGKFFLNCAQIVSIYVLLLLDMQFHYQTMLFYILWCCRRLLRVPWIARRSNQSMLKKSVLNIHWKVWCWNWNPNTLAPWCEELTHWKRPWCWERLRAGGEEGNRGWDGWMISVTQWIRVWANSREVKDGKSGVLQSMGLQRVRHDWVTEWQQYISRGFFQIKKNRF